MNKTLMEYLNGATVKSIETPMEAVEIIFEKAGKEYVLKAEMIVSDYDCEFDVTLAERVVTLKTIY
jgi:hypothetical protein